MQQALVLQLEQCLQEDRRVLGLYIAFTLLMTLSWELMCQIFTPSPNQALTTPSLLSTFVDSYLCPLAWIITQVYKQTWLRGNRGSTDVFYFILFIFAQE